MVKVSEEAVEVQGPFGELVIFVTLAQSSGEQVGYFVERADPLTHAAVLCFLRSSGWTILGSSARRWWIARKVAA